MKTLLALFEKFRRYLLVGGFNTVLNLGMMYIGSSMGLSYLLYTPMGYLTTILFSFFINLHYTFKVRDRRGYRLLGFLCVSLTNLAIVEIIEYVLVDLCSVARWIAVILGMGWYVVTGFLVNNYVVYRNTHFNYEPI